jgi:hypothetical protein
VANILLMGISSWALARVTDQQSHNPCMRNSQEMVERRRFDGRQKNFARG